MRILHLTTFLQGGAGRAIATLATAERTLGHDVLVVASATAPPGYGNYPEYLEQLRSEGVGLHLVDSMFDRNYAANLSVVRALDAWYPAGAEPDVIHAHAAMPSLVALIFAGARRTAPRIVQTMHGWGIRKTAEQAATDVAILRLVDRVIVPSAATAAAMTALGVEPGRLTVVPYGVGEISARPDDRDRALMDEMARRRRDGLLVVACVGTLGARKNQVQLVEAVAERRGSVLAVLVGDGDEGPIRDAIARHRLEDLVVVHGYSRAARRIAASADVLALPSLNEGQPLSVIEAFADGTLAVVSDIPELAELVEDGVTGFRFAADRPGALAEVLAGVAVMPAAARQAMTARARARYDERFTVSAMVDACLSAYDAPATSVRTESRRQESPAA